MFVLACHIEIGDLIFDQVNEVSIVKSVDLISDTAVIKLPTKYTLKGSGETNDTAKSIKAGDKVLIQLAYRDVIEEVEFRGYVKAVRPNTPVEIECEDAVYLLRKKPLNKNFTNTTLVKLLAFIVDGTGINLSGEIPDMKLEKFILKSTNGAQALEKIKEEYGLACFLDNTGNIFAGLRQTEGTGERVEYGLDYNVIEHDLEYRTADQVKIKLKAIAWRNNNEKIEVEVGDQDGEQRTWQTYDVLNKEQLKQLAKSKLATMKYDGYDGTLTGFLTPYANRGMLAEVTDNNYPERAGNYFIPKVEIQFGRSGARRIVTLGRKVS